MQHAAELPQRMVHRRLIVDLAVENLRDAQDDVVRRVRALHLQLPRAVEVDIHECVGDIARLLERHDCEVQPVVDLWRIDAVADGPTRLISLRAVRHPDGVCILIRFQEALPQKFFLRHSRHLAVDLVDKDVLRIPDGLAILGENQSVNDIRHRDVVIDVRHPKILHRDHLA